MSIATVVTHGYNPASTGLPGVVLFGYGNGAAAPVPPPVIPDVNPPSRGGPPLYWWKWIHKHEQPETAEEIREELSVKQQVKADDAVERAVYAIQNDQPQIFRNAQAEYQRIFSSIDASLKTEIRSMFAEEVKFRIQEEEEALELMFLANEFSPFDHNG